MHKIHKKTYSSKIDFTKVVKQDAPSLKKNVHATNFYETVKTNMFKSSWGAYFSVIRRTEEHPMECWKSHFLI